MFHSASLLKISSAPLSIFLTRFFAGSRLSINSLVFSGGAVCGGVVAHREKSPFTESVLTDREFETLLRRSSAIFKARHPRLVKFPSKSEQNRLRSLTTP